MGIGFVGIASLGYGIFLFAWTSELDMDGEDYFRNNLAVGRPYEFRYQNFHLITVHLYILGSYLLVRGVVYAYLTYVWTSYAEYYAWNSDISNSYSGSDDQYNV